MALLSGAIRGSEQQFAAYRLSPTTQVVVCRFVGQELEDNQEEYAVSLTHEGAQPEPLFAALDLAEVLQRLQSLSLPGFDPASSNWEPAR
jgi:hypothetical protein